MNKIISALCLVAVAASANAQTKKKATSGAITQTPAAKSSIATEGGFQTTPTGLEYKIITHGTSTRKPVMGDWITLHMLSQVDDSTLFSTRQVLNNQPAEIQVQAPQRGDVAEGFTYMAEGDSAIFRMAIDSLMTLPNFTPQPWMKKGVGQKIIFYAKLITVKTTAEKQAEMAAAAAKQKTVDDELLQQYFKEKNLKPMKTASGLYYTVDKQGTGTQASMGDTVVANYTGKTMDGKTFDSNIDPAFGHAGQPFSFPVGMGMVIKGWDEAFQLFKAGTKGTIYIPSTLAYGAQSPDPSRIPNNANLIFDIELQDVKHAGNSAGVRPGSAPKSTPVAPKKK